MPALLKFADSDYEYKDADFVVFGVPFDGTTSFRGGARFAPNAIREASINIESFVFDKQTDLKNSRIHDMGNIEEHGNVEEIIKEVKFYISKIWNDSKFPIMLGGEHSITVGSAKAMLDDVSLLFIDAHLDFRDEYLGQKNSHACVARRSFELLGKNRVSSIGIRSISKDEYYAAEKLDYYYIPSYTVKELGWKKSLNNVLEHIKTEHIYLSIDMDGIDPAYAPGVATPEPFGLDSADIKNIILFLGKRLAGADIVEIVPSYDNGNTAMLGARLAQEIISTKSKF